MRPCELAVFVESDRDRYEEARDASKKGATAIDLEILEEG